jgi:transcriptional regulator with XRE-family HTH domain
MTTAPEDRSIPEITLGWRLRMSLEMSDLSREDMAKVFEVDPKTITRWTHDVGGRPKMLTVEKWAELTGVDATWLETGEASQPDSPNGGASVSNILLGRQRLYQLSYVRDAAQHLDRAAA